MSKLKEIKEKAFKVGQATVAAGMLTGAIMGITNKPGTKIINRPQVENTKEIMTEVPFKTMPEMMWLDEQHLIINNELMEYEDACVKYPDDAHVIRKFMQDNLHEKERELESSGADKGEWKTLSLDEIAEIEKRLRQLNANEYLPKDNEPTMER